MSELRKIRITHVHKDDACYPDKNKLIGLEGNFSPEPPHFLSGYYCGEFQGDKIKQFFVGVRYRKI